MKSSDLNLVIVIAIGLFAYAATCFLTKCLSPRVLSRFEFSVSSVIFLASFFISESDVDSDLHKNYPDLYIMLRVFGGIGIFLSGVKIWRLR